MKLRSIICVSAIAAAASASATLTSGNAFARLPITGNTYENALIAIPFAGCGETNAEIYVTNLVMTSNLKAGDKLLYKDGSSYYAWQLATDGGPWQKMATSDDFGTRVTPSAEQTTLPCGKGCWLVRSSATITADSTIYLFGQVNEGSLTTTVPASSDGTIICRPYETGAIDLNTWKPTGVAAGDTVSVPDSTNPTGKKTYTYKDGNWTVQTTTTSKNSRGKTVSTVTDTPVASGTTIPAGVAFMYGRYGTTDLTITWTK